MTAILGSISSAGDHDQINIRNEVGYNMLHYAVAYGHVKIVELLIDHGAGMYVAIHENTTCIIIMWLRLLAKVCCM